MSATHVAAQGNASIWVIDHVFGHFARIDATSGEERARNTALAGEALAP